MSVGLNCLWSFCYTYFNFDHPWITELLKGGKDQKTTKRPLDRLMNLKFLCLLVLYVASLPILKESLCGSGTSLMEILCIMQLRPYRCFKCNWIIRLWSCCMNSCQSYYDEYVYYFLLITSNWVTKCMWWVCLIWICLLCLINCWEMHVMRDEFV